ncbi:hypothetical protein CEE37_09630 [candidate division LCP-89 bacterium B3_LCP]|uniref:Gingipain R n=1 Tax=candidate division LCP-89 bacterium B3_LCP TaxID=2012998 RepID=A0A532UYJ0_UNCL8|nr:MAG: hypothetical protein CEE37_09630 [candidate division LCP-89 bacterium B3_LCP]
MSNTTDLQYFWKKSLSITTLLAALCVFLMVKQPVYADIITFEDNWAEGGINLVSQNMTGVDIVFSIPRMEVVEVDINGERMQTVAIPGVILPNEAGAPDLPCISRFIAIPQGSRVRCEIVESRIEVLPNMNIAPAYEIPRDDSRSVLKYEKNPEIYDQNVFYPEEVVRISGKKQMRGVDVVIVSITPFQFNPVSKDLRIYKDIRMRIDFVGGSGYFGEDRLRSRWWEPVLQQNLINYASLPKVDFDRRNQIDEDNVEYIIIVPDHPVYIAWADTLKRWRNEQGILTGITTIGEIGGNDSVLIEDYINDAYTNWEIPPVAVLLFSDYSDPYLFGICAPHYFYDDSTLVCVSDNFYADVDNDSLPDLTIARICTPGGDDTLPAIIITKILDYERQPYTNPYFYQNPLLSGGWQTSRWFLLFTEVLYGYFANQQGKTPVREYDVYIYPGPGTIWSTATNTSTVVNYFGPLPWGLNYISSTPSYLASMMTGTTAGITNAINNGAFFALHRDHGIDTSWVTPWYPKSIVAGLTNPMHPYVFSLNCSTGRFDAGSPGLAEVFQMIPNGGVGIMAPSGTSFSFVNDTFGWGVFDSMWPDFDPLYGTDPVGEPILRPAFANVSGKFYLEASSWPNNPNRKADTYFLFHHLGDAFTTIYSEVPESLTVAHDSTIPYGTTSFNVTANASSLIGLSLDGEMIGSANGTGVPVNFTLPDLIPGDTVRVTVTKANYFRYITDVPVPGTAIFEGDVTGVWADSTSPYYIFGEITVASSNDTLWIEPGVEVLFQGHYKLNVEGTLFAIGTETDSILFTATDTTEGWHGIRFIAGYQSNLSYCIIQYGKASGPSMDSYGGGIYSNVYPGPSITHCTIRWNSANSGAGGGIYCRDTDAIISYSSIIENSALDGGGIGCMGDPIISHCMITRNSVLPTSTGGGGGIFCVLVPVPSISNCTITGNSAPGNGGGISCFSTEPFNIVNTIVEGNSGGGIRFINCYNIGVSYGDFYNNAGGDFTGEVPPGLGVINAVNTNGDSCDTFSNIFLDPRFLYPTADNYNLSSNSPCIDAGNPNSPSDPDSTVADIGALFYDQLSPAPNCSVSTALVDFGEVIIGNQLNLPLTIYNQGSVMLVIYDIATSEPSFTTDFNPADSLINPGNSLLVTVSFSPGITAIYDDVLVVYNNDKRMDVQLQGTGVSLVQVILMPENPPITVPSSGGSFGFDISCVNHATSSMNFDIWTDITKTNGQLTPPLIGPLNLTFSAGDSIGRGRTQNVPGFAPPGLYSYNAYVGNYPDSVGSSDSFTFEKLETGEGELINDWNNTGESFGQWLSELTTPIPDRFALHVAHPNPFNPTTVLRFQLQDASLVKLSVYDISGRKVVELVNGWRDAGVHEVTFDGSDLASGIYLYRLEASGSGAPPTTEYIASGKMVMVK